MLLIGHVPGGGIFRLDRCQASLFELVPPSILSPIDESEDKQVQDRQAEEDGKDSFTDSIAWCGFGLEGLRPDPVACTVGWLSKNGLRLNGRSEKLTDDLHSVGSGLLGVSDSVGTERSHSETPACSGGTNEGILMGQ